MATPAAVAGAMDHLHADLERIFSDSNFANAQWGVEVVSLDRGDVLYEHNSTRLYMPASNNKLLTTVSALIRLGPDYRYKTNISTDGTVADGILRGNLVITGSGDPTTECEAESRVLCHLPRPSFAANGAALLLRENHREYPIGCENAAVVVAAFRDDLDGVLRAKLLVDELYEGLAAGAPGSALRHGRA